jgi:8-oxo-dGTP diphosphatase
MELWDAYTIEEEITSTILLRDHPIPIGLYHVVVEIIVITNNHQVLITKRDPVKTFPLQWEITGGSVLLGETKEQGAIRELFEETGIQASVEEITCLHRTVGVDYLFYSFVCQKEIDESIITLQPGETIDYQIIPFREFEEMLHSGKIVNTINDRYQNYRHKLYTTIGYQP